MRERDREKSVREREKEAKSTRGRTIPLQETVASCLRDSGKFRDSVQADDASLILKRKPRISQLKLQ